MSRFDQFHNTYEDTVSEATKVFGEDYDYFSKLKVRHMNQYLKRVFSPGTLPLHILEIGCGSGGVQGNLSLLEFDHKSFAIELSLEMLKTAKLRNPAVRALNADATRLPFKSASLDVAYFAVVVHHVPVPVRTEVFQEVYRVLKPGGVVAVFEHNPFNPVTTWVVSHSELDRDAVLTSLPRLCGLLRRCGFEIGHARYTTFFPRILSLFRPLEERLGWLPLGGQYYVFGRKPKIS